VSSNESPEEEEPVQPANDSSNESETAESINLQDKIAERWQETETIKADDLWSTFLSPVPQLMK
jgi:hypothetical protein